MNDRLAAVLADLQAEGDQLDALVAPLADDASGWRRPTPAAGWDVAHQVAHLAWTDDMAVLAATDRDGWDAGVLAALEDPDGFVDAEAARGSDVPAPELLDRWRATRTRLAEVLSEVPEGTRVPWYGPPMSPTSMATARFMETWAHARDVAAALDLELPADDRVRHVVHLGVRTRGFAYATRGLALPAGDVRVSVTLPSGERVEHGAHDAVASVTGSAHDFALVVTQRLHPEDADLTVVGAEASEWLAIAQAFAGPPGPGREPSRG
ncbi:MAG: TIGR03084 family metal-binding protein [Nocardioidaceae bacterium]